MHVSNPFTSDKIQSFFNENKGAGMLKETARFLSETLKVDNVIIGCLISGGLKVRTLAFSSFGKELGEMEYNLEYTPCENIVNRKACYYPKNIISLFPKDKELQDLKGESYLGTPVCDKNGNPVGLIALIHSKQIPNAEEKTAILEEVAGNISPEICKYHKNATAAA